MLNSKNHHLTVWLMLVGMALITFAIYAQGLHGGFLFDDYPNIVDNKGVQVETISLRNLVNAALSSPSSDFKRPLASISFAANYLTSGMDPVSMKITNIFIHIFNGFLLFVLTEKILSSTISNDTRSTCKYTAAIVALSWLLLPINLTAVLYIVQRMESLANLFVLAGLIGYVSGRKRMTEGKSGFLLATGSLIGGAGLGLLAKETAVMVVPYGFAIEVFIFKWMRADASKNPIVSRDWRLFGFYIATLALPILVGAVWLGPSLLNPSTWERRDFTLETRLLSELRIVTAYIGWSIVPTPQALSFYHDDFFISRNLFDPWTTIASAFALLGMFSLSIYLKRRLPIAGLGLALFLSCHLLTATVLPLELIYEHRNYFASFGLVLAIVSILKPIPKVKGQVYKYRIPRYTALIALLLLWSTTTALTARAWDSPLSLAAELAWRAPYSPRAQYELGRSYIIYSRYDPKSPMTELAYAPLEKAMTLPGASILPEQALIFFNARLHRPISDAWWTSLILKLKENTPTVQDESSLQALADCVRQSICDLDKHRLSDAFIAALGHPQPTGRLLAIYADFSWNTLGNLALARSLQERAIAAAPREMAYRISGARMAASTGDWQDLASQLAVIKKFNLAGRFDDEVSRLQGLLNKGVSGDRNLPPTTPREPQ